MIALVLAMAAAWIVLHPISLPAPRTLRVQDDDWQLPRRSRPDIDALVLAIVQNKLWGTNGLPAQPEEKPLTPPNWRITGVLSAGAERFVLLAVEGQPIQQLKTGEKLPGGAKILTITPDRICILLNGKKRALKTYRE